MENNIAKEKIINALKNVALNKQNAAPFDTDTNTNIFTIHNEDNVTIFVQNFFYNGGTLVLCETKKDIIENLRLASQKYKWNDIYCNNQTIQQILDTANIKYKENTADRISVNVGITLCESLIARHGSIVMSSEIDKDGKISSISETHVILATINQIVDDIKTALQCIQDKYSKKLPSYISIISGPSKTTAIENTITNGAQGKKSLFLFLLLE